MQPKHVRMLREEKVATPFAANNRLKILGTFFQWAIEAGHIEANPVRKVRFLDTPSDGYYTWSLEDIHTFLRRHPPHTKAGLAFFLLFFLGVRRSDLIRLGPHMETGDGGIRFLETKDSHRRPKITELFIQPELRAVLDLHKSDDRPTYITTVHGKPYSLGGFGHWFRRKCDRARLWKCSAHGVRKAAATMAVNRGASERQLMALFGWTSTTSIRTYVYKMDRKKLAAEAGMLLTLGNPAAKPGRKRPPIEVLEDALPQHMRPRRKG